MSSDYHSYLLRLWRTHAAAPWQFSLQDTLTSQTRSFADPDAVLGYLLDVAGSRYDPPPGLGWTAGETPTGAAAEKGKERRDHEERQGESRQST